MIQSEGGAKRLLHEKQLQADMVIVGGGLSGVCAAITAARQGLKIILVQDRPVLGGNASSEVRLWILGATSHMGNNNRWAREGGVVDEILVENTYRNPEGNPVIFDTILLDKVTSEPNVSLLLNTAVVDLDKKDATTIRSVKAFCSQNQTSYSLTAPLFCDASGDGIVGFLAGAAFRMGAESKEEFNEKFAPSKEYGELLGHSLYFYTKDTGRPVKFVPPLYALDDITTIPRFKSFNSKEFGCRLWWIEYGGRLDTVYDTEDIKWELWKVVYGVWNYIKNSGNFPDAENLTLEWVGTIPGKRESRRFEGDYMMTQQDIVNQHTYTDAVAFGGWSIDLHPADGVFSEKPGCNQWHSKGLYQIPYRSLYSRNISNLFLAGRIISASHVAFGSTRVMATSAYAAQAVAIAALICTKNNMLPAAVSKPGYISSLQEALQKTGQFIPGLALKDRKDLVQYASITASSEFALTELPGSDIIKPLDVSQAQLIPVLAGKVPSFIFHANAATVTGLDIELRSSSRANNFTPDVIVEKKTIPIHAGRNCIKLEFDFLVQDACYLFVTFIKNPLVQLHYSENRITGLLSVFNTINLAVSNLGKQTPPEDIGVDEFEFWCPARRPEGHNIAFKSLQDIPVFKASNVANGIDRPTNQPNAWVADLQDKHPQLVIDWNEAKTIRKIDLFFDTDYDHPMESVLMGHPENVMPFCVRNFHLLDDNGKVIWKKEGNYQTVHTITFSEPVTTKKLTLVAEHPSKNVPAAVFAVRCYS